MFPFFHLFGRDIPLFGIMVLLGIGAASLVVLWQCKKTGFNSSDALLTGCMAFAGVIVGAKLLKPLIKLPDIIVHWEKYAEVPVGDFFTWLFGETVFYGGLIGGILAAYIFCRCFKMPFLRIADLYAAAIPAGHAFGRIGCLMGGCCYGIQVSENHPFAIVYPVRSDIYAELAAPGGVPLLAVPIIEALGNLIIAAIVLIFQRKNNADGRGLALYGLLYSVQRFVLEFFRGDLVRGVYGGISTSQILSLVLFAASLTLFAATFKKKKAV